MRLAEALELAAQLQKSLKFAPLRTNSQAPLPGRPALVLVGSARRGEPTMCDLDLLVVVPDRADFAPVLASANLVGRMRLGADRGCGARRRSLVLLRSGRRPFQVDLFLVRRSELPYALYHYTGSRQYNIRTRAHAKARGWLLNQYGLFYTDRPSVRVRKTAHLHTERALAAFLGVSYRKPEDRL